MSNYRDSAIYKLFPDMAGLPPRSLQMAIQGFVLEEGTKPVHERHLQVFLRTQASSLAVYRDQTNATTPNSHLEYLCPDE